MINMIVWNLYITMFFFYYKNIESHHGYEYFTNKALSIWKLSVK